MKKVSLILILVVVLTSVKAQSVPIADKNNPKSILYAFQKLAQFHGFQNFPMNDIVDSLSANGLCVIYDVSLSQPSDGYTLVYNEREFALHKEKYVDKKEYIDEYGDSYDIGIGKTVYSLDTVTNTIVSKSTWWQNPNDGSNSVKSEYRLLNSITNTKLIWSWANFYTNIVSYQRDVRIYDLDSHTGILSMDSTSMELFRIRSKDFFVESTPDSLMYFGYYFLISCADKGIAQCILEFNAGEWDRGWATGNKSSYKDLKGTQWLKGNIVDFYFDNGKFTRSEPYFSNDFFFEEDE